MNQLSGTITNHNVLITKNIIKVYNKAKIPNIASFIVLNIFFELNDKRNRLSSSNNPIGKTIQGTINIIIWKIILISILSSFRKAELNAM